MVALELVRPGAGEGRADTSTPSPWWKHGLAPILPLASAASVLGSTDTTRVARLSPIRMVPHAFRTGLAHSLASGAPEPTF
jgi:hypothetical protein